GQFGRAGDALAALGRALAVAGTAPAMADLRLMILINQAASLGDLDRLEDGVAAARMAWRESARSANVIREHQARSVASELLFELGRWDEALAAFTPGMYDATDFGVSSCTYGIAAVVRLHRADPGARSYLRGLDRCSAVP